MLKSIRLTNFKCFLDCIIPLNNYTLLTGINGAGKSSVIQAMLLFDYAVKRGRSESITVGDVMGVRIGDALNLVNQNPEEISEGAFAVQLDQRTVIFNVNKNNPADLQSDVARKSKGLSIQYLNAERMGPRMTYEAGGDLKIAMDGSNASFIMERMDYENCTIPPMMIPEGTVPKFSKVVEVWMRLIFDNSIRFNVKRIPEKGEVGLEIGGQYTESYVLPTLTGFGISYELSIVVAGLLATTEKNSVLIVENPEAHLHPSGQSNIAKFLAKVAEAGVQVIVETHSEHVVDGARLQLAIDEQTSKLTINYFDSGVDQPVLRSIQTTERGELLDWPRGFMDQKQKDIMDLLKLSRTK